MNTIQCPHCGTQNGSGQALCTNCQSPLTAYSGQLRGETYEGKLAAQVDRMHERPAGVTAMAAFLAFICLGWPLRAILTAFAQRAHLNADSTNYAQTAFGTLFPIFITIVCLPIAAGLLWAAWASFTQQPRGWQASLGALGAFTVYILIKYSDYRNWALLWVGAALCLAAIWIHKSTRAWFGMS